MFVAQSCGYKKRVDRVEKLGHVVNHGNVTLLYLITFFQFQYGIIYITIFLTYILSTQCITDLHLTITHTFYQNMRAVMKLSYLNNAHTMKKQST